MSTADVRHLGSSSVIGLCAAAFLLGALLLAADILVGAVVYGGHLDAAVTGPTLSLVDALGWVTYSLALLAVAFALSLARQAMSRGERPGFAWRLSLGVPLVAVGLMFIRLGVGDSHPGGMGSRWLTTLLVGGVAGLVITLPWVWRSANEGPARAFLGGVLVLTVAWVSLRGAGHVRAELGTREARIVQAGLVLLWLAVFLLLVLVRTLRPIRLAFPTVRRLCAVGFLVCAPPSLVWVAHRSSQPAVGSGSHPSVVLVVFDAMRADRLSTYGGRVPTPNFDELASEGVLFEQAYAQAPWTVPSMVSFFSSDYPALPAGVAPRKEFTVSESTECLAEALGDRGYATCAITANYALGEHTGILQGFSEKVVINHHLRRRNVFSQALPGLEALVQAIALRQESDCLMDTSPVILQHLAEFLKRGGSGSFLVWLHFMDPHDPYAPPDRYRSELLRGEGPWPVFAPHDPALGTPTDTDIRAGNVVLDTATQQYISDLYDAEIAYADDLLREAQRLVEDVTEGSPVIWCVLSDHGEEFWDHGSYYHGHTLYEELVRVPLILSGAGVPEGRRVADPVALVDVMPTLFELCGLAPPAGYQGHSLTEHLQGSKDLDRRPVYAGSTFYYEPAEAVIEGEYKLIRETVSRRVELYNLVVDPAEEHNVAAEHPEVCERLTQLLDAWRRRQRTRSESEDEDERREHLERLRTLGYL